MKPETKERITIEVAGYVKRILDSYAGRQLTGAMTFEVHLSQGGLAQLEATFKERLK